MGQWKRTGGQIVPPQRPVPRRERSPGFGIHGGSSGQHDPHVGRPSRVPPRRRWTPIVLAGDPNAGDDVSGSGAPIYCPKDSSTIGAALVVAITCPSSLALTPCSCFFLGHLLGRVGASPRVVATAQPIDVHLWGGGPRLGRPTAR